MSETSQSNDKYQKVLADLENAFQTLQEENQRQQERIKSLAGAIRDLRAMRENDASRPPRITGTIKQQVFRDRINKLFRNGGVYEVQERLWLRPSSLDLTPPFIPISQRPTNSNGVSTRFISFINFKGGVGKTTLVANIGAALAAGQYDLPGKNTSRPLRVLFVDLDFQATLTDRCVDQSLLVANGKSNIFKQKTVASLFDYPPKLSIAQLLLPVLCEKNASIIRSADALDVKDAEAFMKLACGLIDTRFYFRAWFHKPEVLSQFDLVIFDCPPRLTASTVCALTVSDYAFIPTSPDLFDQSPITRTNTFIQRISKELNTPCQVGGVILNRTNKEGSLTSKEKNFVERINLMAKEDGDPNLNFLRTYVPRRSGDKDSIIGNIGEPLPCGNPKRPLPFLNNLASEIYARIYQ